MAEVVNPIDDELEKWKNDAIRRCHGVKFGYLRKSEAQEKRDGKLNEAEKITSAFLESKQIWKAMEK